MIIGVAIRNHRITIMLERPNRHSDCFEYAQNIGIDFAKEKLGVAAKDQGFYTQYGKYLNREQAFKYAKRIKQPLLDSPHFALCSENLW